MFILARRFIVCFILLSPQSVYSQELWRCLVPGESRERVTNLPAGVRCRVFGEARYGFNRVPNAVFLPRTLPSSREIKKRQRPPSIPSTVTHKEKEFSSVAGSLGTEIQCILKGSFLAPEAGRYRVRIRRGGTQVDDVVLRSLKAEQRAWQRTLEGACKQPEITVKRLAAGKGRAGKRSYREP